MTPDPAADLPPIGLNPLPHLEAGARYGDETCIVALAVISSLRARLDEAERERDREATHVRALIAEPFKREEGLRASLAASQRELRAAEARLVKLAAALRTLDRNFAFEVHQCEKCGAADPMADCDAAALVKSALAVLDEATP